MNACIMVVVSSTKPTAQSTSGSSRHLQNTTSKSGVETDVHTLYYVAASTSRSHSGNWSKSWSEHRSILGGEDFYFKGVFENLWKRGR